MKLSKKLGLLATTTIAAFAFSCAAYAIEQKSSSEYSVEVAFWDEEVLKVPERIDYQYSSDKTFPDGPKTITEEYQIGDSSYIIGPNLSAGKSYWVRWKVYGTSTYSAPFEVVTTPDFDKNAKVYQTNATNNSATLSWTAAKGATGYEVFEYETGKKLKTFNTNKGVLNVKKDTTVTIKPIRKSSTGSFVARDGRINTLRTSARKLPSVPSNIKSEKDWYTWGHFMKFTWNPSAGADGYDIEYSLYNSKKATVEDVGYYETTKISDVKNAFYKVRLRSYIKCGEKKICSNWSAYTYHCDDLADDVSLKSMKKKRIRVAWLKTKGAKKYIVYMAKGSDGGYKKIKVTKKRNLVIKKFKKKKLKKGTTYYFRVVAVGKFGKKTWKSNNTASSSIELE